MSARIPTSARSSAGFTLIEVLMALLVMTVGLLGLLQAVNVAFQHNLRNRLREQAVLLAEEQMLVLRRIATTGAAFPNASSASKLIAGVPRSFNVTRDCQRMDNTATGSTTGRLKVTVSWNLKKENFTHVVYSLKKM